MEEEGLKSVQGTYFLFKVEGCIVSGKAVGKRFEHGRWKGCFWDCGGRWSSAEEEEPGTESAVLPHILIVSSAVNNRLFAFLPTCLH